ncbi:MAG: ribosome maturation factor RimM [Vicinamibacterales bacterium]
MQWQSMVTVGRITRPQHNRGEVLVISDTDFPEERFAPGATVFASREAAVMPLTVTSSREHDGRWVVGFQGVGTINDAEALRGLELRIPVETLHALPAGSYFTHDLVGCEVRTVGGQVVGTIERVDIGVGIPMLVLAGPDGEVLVPFTAAFCRGVDVQAKRIEIDPPPGLIELNVPRRRSP